LRQQLTLKPEFLLSTDDKRELELLKKCSNSKILSSHKRKESEIQGMKTERLRSILEIFELTINKLKNKIKSSSEYLTRLKSKVKELESFADKIHQGNDFNFVTSELISEEEYESPGNSWYPWEGGETRIRKIYKWRICKGNLSSKKIEELKYIDNTQPPNCPDVPECFFVDYYKNRDSEQTLSYLESVLENEWITLQGEAERLEQRIEEVKTSLDDFNIKKDFVLKQLES
jgi:chaperonin cofactor prefoldin